MELNYTSKKHIHYWEEDNWHYRSQRTFSKLDYILIYQECVFQILQQKIKEQKSLYI